MCKGGDHEHGDHRCRCCSPEGQRARRCETALRQRGYEGDIDEDYAEAAVADRAGMAEESTESTYDGSPTVRRSRARTGDLTRDEQESLAVAGLDVVYTSPGPGIEEEQVLLAA